MRMDELKRGLWGYKKDSVYRYIASLEERASERAAEKEAKLEQLEEEMKRRIAEMESAHNRQVAELEATVAALREENTAMRENQASVFATMLEAQKYAEQLRADSDRQRRQTQERFSAAVQQKTRQLDGYLEQIQRLRALVQEVLREFDSKMEEAESTLNRLSAQAPVSALEGETPAIPGFGGAAPDGGSLGTEAPPAPRLGLRQFRID